MEQHIIDEVNQVKSLLNTIEAEATTLNGCIVNQLQRGEVKALYIDIKNNIKALQVKLGQLSATAGRVYERWYVAQDIEKLYGVG